jgi:hypothetical protein
MISGEKPLNQFDGELAALRHQRKMDALGESPAVDRVLDVTVKLAEKAGLANRMKKPADKMRLRYFLGVCRVPQVSTLRPGIPHNPQRLVRQSGLSRIVRSSAMHYNKFCNNFAPSRS